MAEFDQRRRPYVPMDVFVAFDDFGTALVEKWGMEGICCWMLFLAACKREPNQGTFTYTTDEEAWGKIGAQATLFTLDEFFRLTGRWKKTSKTRSGRIKHVVVTPKLWEKWNTKPGRNPRKQAQNTDKKQTENGEIRTPEAEAEQGSRTAKQEVNGAAIFKIPSTASAQEQLLAAIRNRDDTTGVMIDQFGAQLPPPAFITAHEDLLEHYDTTRNDAGYVRTILERMVAEGQYERREIA